MDKTIYFLTYRSTALVEALSSDVQAIVEASQRNNAHAGLTGFLSLDRGTFVQFLEGPKVEIEALLEVLRTDPRHTDLIVTSHGWLQDRLFDKWQMQLVLTAEQERGASASLPDAARVLPQMTLERHGIYLARARRRIPVIANSPEAPDAGQSES